MRLIIPVSLVLASTGASAAEGQPESQEADGAHLVSPRYMFAPTARPLEAGDLVLSARELVFLSLDYGATDWLSFSAGAAPLLWINRSGHHALFGARVGIPLGTGVFGGASINAVVLPFSDQGPFRVEALPEAHFSLVFRGWETTLSVGIPFNAANWTTTPVGPFLGQVTITASYAARLTSWLGIFTENWVFVGPPSFLGDRTFVLLNVLAARMNWRLRAGELAIDVGAGRGGQWRKEFPREPYAESFAAAFPWLAVSWRVALIPQ